MALCYWGVCTCPDHQPCPQHAGKNCGYWNGELIQDISQVNDALTRDAELAIVALDGDRQLVRDMRKQLKQKRDVLKKESDDIRSKLNGPSTMGERRKTARQIEEAYKRLDQIDSEKQKILTDLDSINARSSSAGALISTFLIVPYTSSSAYCACYDIKRDRLAAIASQISQQQAKLTRLFIKRNAIKQEIMALRSPMPNLKSAFKIVGTATFVAVIIVFILTGFAAALFTLMAGLFLFAILVFDTLLTLIDIDDQIMVTRQNIVRLNLSYYRMQSISTCQHVPLLEGEDDKAVGREVEEENAWYQKAVPDYALYPDSEK